MSFSPENALPLPSPSRERLVLVASAVIIESMLVVAALGWGAVFMEAFTTPFAKLQWNWIDAMRGAALSLAMFGLLVALERWPRGPLRHIRQLGDEVLRPLLRPCRWPDVILFSTLAGFCEELLFRGAVQHSLVDWLGPWPGILLAAVLFGLAHAITVTYTIAAACIGLLLGGVYYWTDSLLVVMVAHGLYDVWAMVYLLNTPATPAPTSETSPEADRAPSGNDSCTNSHASSNSSA